MKTQSSVSFREKAANRFSILLALTKYIDQVAQPGRAVAYSDGRWFEATPDRPQHLSSQVAQPGRAVALLRW